ncbi:ATP-dependent RNA helicase [Giardia muris]|uniref:ATP-dependent RNA helicase n=1 Tax=Giardia muris TaxID=5742 RepID=A0A4Z1SZ30_GIAMU|nr:ATP-dependent RNA helicase [Giardia muris]|eukprot:TNJ26913.1 ATP-dependent RNA helicase [Giardia muris]
MISQKKRRQWLKDTPDSRIVFRRELLEAADEVATNIRDEATGPIASTDVKLFTNGNFEKLGVHRTLVDALKAQGITKPTWIQMSAIPKILMGENVVLKAQTGSGKTIAFLAPILTRMLEGFDKHAFSRSAWATTLLIVSPTKELAQQTEVFTRSLLTRTLFVTGSLCGSINREKEKAALRKGMTIISCTPGRLEDHLINTSSFSLKGLKYLVLDECDHLLQGGFQSCLELLFERARKEADRFQLVLASATADKRVLEFSRKYASSSSVIGSLFDEQVSETDLGTIPKGLSQVFCIVPTKMRLAALLASLAYETANNRHVRVLVFIESRDVCGLLHELLLRLATAQDDNFILSKVYHLHGGLEASTRHELWDAFLKEGGVLVTTDVAARGLNLGLGAQVHHKSMTIGVDVVIQYEAPTSLEQYVHRVGRAARIGQKGKSILFLLECEAGFAQYLKTSGITIDAVPVDRLAPQVLGFNKPIRLMERIQARVEELISTDPALKRQAARAFSSYIRGYTVRSQELRHIFSIHNLHLGHLAKSFGLNDPPSRFLAEYKPSKDELRAQRLTRRLPRRPLMSTKPERSRMKMGTKVKSSERDTRPVITDFGRGM